MQTSLLQPLGTGHTASHHGTDHADGCHCCSFQLTAPAPRSAGGSEIAWGGTSLSFVSAAAGAGAGGALATVTAANAKSFVVGTDGGAIFKCNYEMSALAGVP
jgi:hypothetical protein